MDPRIKDIVDHLEGLGYTFQKNHFVSSGGWYYFYITPPGFPHEGVPTEKVTDYTIEERNKIIDIIRPRFDTRNFTFCIKIPDDNPYPFPYLRSHFLYE